MKSDAAAKGSPKQMNVSVNGTVQFIDTGDGAFIRYDGKTARLVSQKEVLSENAAVKPALSMEDIKSGFSCVGQKTKKGIVSTLYRSNDDPKKCVLVHEDKIDDFDVKDWGKI